MKNLKDHFRSPSQNVKGVIYALIVLIGNGFHPIINNARPSDLNALQFSFMLSLWEFIIAMPFIIREQRRYKKEPNIVNEDQKRIDFPVRMQSRSISILLIVGLIFSIATYFYVEGMQQAGSIASSIALKSSPIYAFFIGMFFLHERPNRKQIIFTILMLFGLYYLGTEGKWSLGSFSLWFAILLAVPLLWTIAHSLTKPLLESRQATTLHVICIRSGVITLMLGTLSLVIFGWVDFYSIFTHPLNILFSFLMGGSYFLMHWAWYNSIRTINISYASALVTPSPVITTMIAVLFLHEPFYLYHLIGMLVVFSSLYGLILSNPQKSSKIVEKPLKIQLLNE